VGCGGQAGASCNIGSLRSAGRLDRCRHRRTPGARTRSNLESQARRSSRIDGALTARQNPKAAVVVFATENLPYRHVSPAVCRGAAAVEYPGRLRGPKAAISLDLDRHSEQFCAFRRTIGENIGDLRRVGKSGSGLSLPSSELFLQRRSRLTQSNRRPRWLAAIQGCCVRKVSQLATSPDFKPVVNHWVRCADVP
jgi:hypothetical protein